MVNVTSRPTLDKCFAAGFLKALQFLITIVPIKHCATLSVTGL